MKKRRKKAPAAPTIGRPESDDPKTLRIPVRVGKSDLDKIRADAAAANLTVTAYVRRRLNLPDTGYGSGS